MTDTMNLRADRAAADSPIKSAKPTLLGRFAAQYSSTTLPFEVVLPDGAVQRFGQGAPTFRVTLKNANGLRAITSLDEGRIGDAYLTGDLDIDGDMVKPFELRRTMKDFHFLTEAWRYLQPLIFGQVHTNRAAIT